MEISLEGKTVLITGGSRGIGKAAVDALVAAGAQVICHYNNTRPEGSFTAIQADLASTQDVLQLVERVQSEFGGIDVLINNAGLALESPVNAADTDWLESWDRTQAVNLRAAALLFKKFYPGMAARGGGIVINVSSRAAHRGDTEDYLAYAASKGGMEALTKSLARAFGKEGILAYGVAPGFTRTSMAEDFIEKYGMDYAMKDIALDALTEPHDLAPLFVFLSSGLARHATGTTIDVNAASYVR
jgi:NAD(P)-dependent dehydrogenase (short-subunit alcohol dehydrogenase family)